jgi:hypothetical protein
MNSLNKESHLQLTEFKIKLLGGLVTNNLTKLNTHIIIDKNNQHRIKSLNFNKNSECKLISDEWINECYEKNSFIDFLNFEINIVKRKRSLELKNIPIKKLKVFKIIFITPKIFIFFKIKNNFFS